MSFQSKGLSPQTQTVSELFKTGVITVLKLSIVLTYNNALGLPNSPQTPPPPISRNCLSHTKLVRWRTAQRAHSIHYIPDRQKPSTGGNQGKKKEPSYMKNIFWHALHMKHEEWGEKSTCSAAPQLLREERDATIVTFLPLVTTSGLASHKAHGKTSSGHTYLNNSMKYNRKEKLP